MAGSGPVLGCCQGHRDDSACPDTPLFWKSSQLKSRVGDTDRLYAESQPDPAGSDAALATEEFYLCHIVLCIFTVRVYTLFSAEKHNRAVAVSEKSHNSGQGNSSSEVSAWNGIPTTLTNHA